MRLSCCTLAACTLLPAATPLAGQDTMDHVAWLAGCWEQGRGDRITVEMWMPPAGGLMLGASRTTVGNIVRGEERLRLELRDGRLVYTALPTGQRETRFLSSAVSDSTFTVENPEHDFPTKVIYRRHGVDSLVARIEGPGRDGATRGIDFPFRRIRCETP